ncbi:ATP-binding protein [Candidatus Shapirobacteria bacterium]|nr:ATP-binding protein [Candidatus Shapirobacteria bacterium]
MKIKRSLEVDILNHFEKSGKGVVILGPRQAGKTTLVSDILAIKKWKTLVLNGDRRGDWWEILQSRELTKIKLLLSGYEALFVDEAQKIPEIGTILKIILDEMPGMKVLVTGSSSLDLSSKISEPLTGRVYNYKLYPISQLELGKTFTLFEMSENLEERLVVGSYPEVFSLAGIINKQEYLANITDNYLYRDLLEYDGIKNSSKIRDLLKLLAFQIGQQVSVNELATSLSLSRDTVSKYIDLLEKSFVIFRLGGFSRNLRKEVSKMDKIYFYDLGIRNTIIGNLSLLNSRNDVGQLWENFLIVERIKKQTYQHKLFSQYYWRLNSGAEIDLVEEESGQLTGFEFKWGKKVVSGPKSWIDGYPSAKFETVNKENYGDFLK